MPPFPVSRAMTRPPVAVAVTAASWQHKWVIHSCRRRRRHAATHNKSSCGGGGGGGGGGVVPSRPRTAPVEEEPANNRNGFRRFEILSRSPLHHKVGLPLASFLYEGKLGERVQQLFPNFVKPLSSDDRAKEESSLDRVVSEGFRAWRRLPAKKRTEPALTAEIGKRIESALRSSQGGGGMWSVRTEARGGKGAKGRVGILLQRQDGGDGGTKAGAVPALAVEVGRRNDDEWWSKLDQGMEYMQRLRNFREPALLAVVTFAEPPHRAKEFVLDTARIGVFLATPRTDPALSSSGENSFRLSMLWRGQTSDVDSLSRDFGRALRAAFLLPCWNAAQVDYAYLGPNCCRLGPKVLRAYDNRPMYTARRPDVYLGYLADETSEVCSYADRDLAGGGGVAASTHAAHDNDNDDDDAPEPLPFGEHGEGSDTRDWLWQFRGRFAVIAVPFYGGRHHARRPSEFVPLLRQLKRLHGSGYVHGDLRCRNVVFGAGRLIDFDLGGRLDREGGSPAYPRGYSDSLVDGYRRGEAGKPVTIMDDVHAMTTMLFKFHQMKPPSETAEAKVELALVRKMLGLSEFGQKKEEEAGADQARASRHIDEVISFLEEAENRNWTIAPDATMLEKLANYGYAVTGLQGTATPRKGTEPATGSLEKGVFG